MSNEDICLKNCHAECVKLLEDLSDEARIKKVFVKDNPWGSKLGSSVNHLKGDYWQHFVVQDGDQIWDPFLPDQNPIPVGEYLETAYTNPDELKIV